MFYNKTERKLNSVLVKLADCLGSQAALVLLAKLVTKER